MIQINTKVCDAFLNKMRMPMCCRILNCHLNSPISIRFCDWCASGRLWGNNKIFGNKITKNYEYFLSPINKQNGAVYIFHGAERASFSNEPAQSIFAKDLRSIRGGRSLQSFGSSLAGGVDLDGDGYGELAGKIEKDGEGRGYD
jgi:hypothetical protein